MTSRKGMTAIREADTFLLPMALWPVWGAALGFAAYAYAVRRRGTCGTCGRRR